ncbi:hypothetical protein D3C72_372500 [compost metagenome]
MRPPWWLQILRILVTIISQIRKRICNFCAQRGLPIPRALRSHKAGKSRGSSRRMKGNDVRRAVQIVQDQQEAFLARWREIHG